MVVGGATTKKIQKEISATEGEGGGEDLKRKNKQSYFARVSVKTCELLLIHLKNVD